jgi:hypothetical protein
MQRLGHILLLLLLLSPLVIVSIVLTVVAVEVVVVVVAAAAAALAVHFLICFDSTTSRDYHAIQQAQLHSTELQIYIT